MTDKDQQRFARVASKLVDVLDTERQAAADRRAEEVAEIEAHRQAKKTKLDAQDVSSPRTTEKADGSVVPTISRYRSWMRRTGGLP